MSYSNLIIATGYRHATPYLCQLSPSQCTSGQHTAIVRCNHSMSRKPTFLFVPGAWHLPPYFDPLISYLSAHGYPSVAVTLPAVNSSPAVTSLQPDVDAAVAALAETLSEGSDVVVVMHSYGGMVGTDAVGRVVKELSGANEGNGKKSGKIQRLVYVTAHVPLEGQTLFQAIEGEIEGPPPPIGHVIFEVCNSHLTSTPQFPDSSTNAPTTNRNHTFF